MKKIFAILSFTFAAGFLISGCSGSSSSSTPATSVGLSMPSNISPVPTNSTTVASSKLAKGVSLSSVFSAVATDPGTDYSNATTSKHVEEHVLSQFSIINTILDAMSQTHFSEAANLGKGPYKSMIAWKEDNGGGGPQGGGGQKKLQPWIVDSSIIVENGQNVNQVLAWIQDSQQGTPVVIRVKVKIYASPTLKTDGSYQDYGIWTLNAVFNNNSSRYFAASASIGSSGEAIVKFHDNTQPSQEVKAILNTSNGSGYGEISYPDYNGCQSQPCTIVDAKYSYDGTTVGVITTDGVNTTGPSFKNRTSTTDVTMFYGLYDSVTGADLLKTKNFGFPLKYTVGNVDNYAYYGSWQGRHSLWANGGSIPLNTTLTRMDLGPNQPAETYTVTNASNFSGSLTKRTLVASNISNILNLPVNTWTNMSKTIMWNGSNWCDVDPSNMSSCGPNLTDLTALVADPNNPNQFIGINGVLNNTNVSFVVTNGYFYTATLQNGKYQAINPNTAATFTSGNQLWVNMGGSIYIEYTNKQSANGYQSGVPIWVKKKLTAFDQQTWTPTFDDTADTAYILTSGQQYYLMNQGTNFVLTTGVNLTFQIEVQTVANPLNATTFTGSGTIFTPQWSNGYATNYSFVTSSSDTARYLNLVYNYVDQNDPNLIQLGVQAGDIVTTGIYGLVANDGTQYNWDYATTQNPYGLLTYLVDSNNQYKLLDDPISLKSFTVTNAAGSITVSPMYSGWMSGLPDIYSSLRLTNWVMTSDLQTKVYNIPDGTAVDDATDNTKHYLIRPLQMSEFLNPITGYTGPVAPSTVSADLTTVPTLDSTGIIPDMATMPNITVITYSEGKLIQ